MNLYLVRHAHALPLEAPGIETDGDRPLSDEGKEQIVALAQALLRTSVRFDRVLSSPLARARQTAEGLAQRMGVSADSIEAVQPLEPGGSAKKIARLLRKMKAAHIALVGHEPDLSSLTSWLIGSKRAQLDLAKAGVACVVCDGPPRKGAGTLAWLVTPSWYPCQPGQREAPEPTTVKRID
jgi:phosphohistidine phosphatase